jgi:catechol 2,3-dioxygenase-like lactoylglutathione lyase family enzyme
MTPEHGEDGEMIQASGIEHIVLHVNDVERAKKFYTEILGMTAYRENDRQVFLHAGQQGWPCSRSRVISP